ncbi:MAG: hypothetical protein JKX81_15140 [Arenicella sp.]|nr:hypothetical protein [Arenicella sp.]
MKFSIKPKKNRLDQVVAWLSEEYEQPGASFYSNRTIIQNAFQNRHFHCVTNGSKTLAFCVFEIFGDYSILHIAAVDHRIRGRGVGAFLVKNHLSYLAKNNVFAVWLECQPTSSVPFWHGMKFQNFPEHYDDFHEQIKMYRPTTKITAYSEVEGNAGILKLWDCEPYQSENVLPRWSWPLHEKQGRLLAPIVHPANRNWNIAWHKNGLTVAEGKVKYFCAQTRHPATFLILRELPDISMVA